MRLGAKLNRHDCWRADNVAARCSVLFAMIRSRDTSGGRQRAWRSFLRVSRSADRFLSRLHSSSSSRVGAPRPWVSVGRQVWLLAPFVSPCSQALRRRPSISLWLRAKRRIKSCGRRGGPRFPRPFSHRPRVTFHLLVGFARSSLPFLRWSSSEITGKG